MRFGCKLCFIKKRFNFSRSFKQLIKNLTLQLYFTNGEFDACEM